MLRSGSGSMYSSYPVLLAGIVLLYGLLTQVVIHLFTLDGIPVLTWPPGWLALAILLIGGRPYWPAVFAGTLIAAIMLGNGGQLALLTATACTAGALAGALFLGRLKHFDIELTHRNDYLWLIIAAIIGGGITALISAGAQALFSHHTLHDALHHFLTWWRNDTLSIILVTPIILSWQRLPLGWFKPDRLAETLACFGLALVAGQIIFLGWFSDSIGEYAKAFLMFIFIAWSAIRFGRQGLFLVAAFTGAQALLGAVQGVGFFAQDIAHTNLLNVWFYMFILTCVGLALDFAMLELRQSEQREKTRNQILEMLARDAPLLEILQTIIHAVEEENDDLVCCILVVGDNGEQLLKGAVSNMPSPGHAAVRTVELDISPNVCGNAVFQGKYVIVGDIHKHPFLGNYETLAANAALQPCWSQPIISHAGMTLGAIAMYRRSAQPATADDGRLIQQVANLAGIAIDQSRINEELQQAMLVYRNSTDAMTVSNADGIILNVNPAFTRLTGYSPEEIIGKTHNVLSSGLQGDNFYQSMWQAIDTAGHWQGEIINRRKNGEIYVEWLTINTIFNDDGSVHRRIGLFSDITKKKETEALIWKQANFDTLTKLPNRNMFVDRMKQSIKKAQRNRLPLALMFIDLDRFKEVNDTLGHNIGDKLLMIASERISSCVRETDNVARLGGDEFTVTLGELENLQSVDRIAQEILDELAKPFHLGNELLFISASIGITFYPEDATDIDTLLKNADQAMYSAKHQGRNRYCYFTPLMQAEAQNRMRLASDLRSAVENHQLHIVYQPIVELASGTIHKAEALIRWIHPDKGPINPAIFIPIAEETGTISSIGDWVFHQTAQQLAIWRKTLHPDFQISINKSPAQFELENKKPCSAEWSAYLQALELAPNSMVIEITEGLLLEASNKVFEQMQLMRAAGLQFSLDDFGTGYSSLSYLKKFEIDFLKIDKSFVGNLAPGSDDLALCEAIIVMAHKLGIKVIAEGIETADQCRLLTEANCDYGQGYFFSRPVTTEAFEIFFQTRLR